MGVPEPLEEKSSCLVIYRMSGGKQLEGDWQFVSEKAFDPLKLTVKNIVGTDWMMAAMLKRDSEGGFSMVKFHCSEKESPEENRALEEEFISFMELGITNMRKEGKTLIISAGGVEKTFAEDDIRQRHEETQKAKMMSMKGSGRFG